MKSAELCEYNDLSEQADLVVAGVDIRANSNAFTRSILEKDSHSLPLSGNGTRYTLELKMPEQCQSEKGDEMIYKVLITPVEPSIDDHPNFSGLLADYEIEAGSETEAEDVAFTRFCQESPFRSHNRDDYTISVN